MPRFEITAPDGARYEITAPEGTTEAQALEYAKQQFANAPRATSPAGFPSGYATPAAQAALVRGGVEPGTAPANDRIQPVPGYVGPTAVPQATPVAPAPQVAAPQKENLNLEGAGPGGQVYGEFDTAGTAGVDPNGGPLKWRGTAYGIAGGVLGGAAGLFGGPISAAVGGIGGSAFGTYEGTYKDEIEAGATPEQASKTALDAALLDVGFNVAGGIVLKLGGKVIGTFAKGSDPWKWIMDRLPRRTPESVNVTPGEAGVLTKPDDVQAAAQRAVGMLEQRGGTVTPGQASGQASIAESAARQAAPGKFVANEQLQKNALEDEIKAFRSQLAGDNVTEFPGTALRDLLKATEDRVKDYTRPVWEALGRARDINIVDVAPIRDHARRLLADKDSFGAMDSAEQALLRKIASGKGAISPAEAQKVQSKFFAKANDLSDSMNPNSAMQSLYTDFASAVRKALDAGLEKAVREGGMAPEDLARLQAARDLYKEMNERLYNAALRPARRETLADERVAGAVVRPGDVSSVRALEALQDFAGKVDKLGELTMKGPGAGQAGRAASSAARDVVPVGGALVPQVGASSAKDLSLFVRRAGAAGSMDEKAAAKFAADYGIDAGGRPLQDVAREALAGVRANFFEKHAGTPEAMARLRDKLGDPDMRRTFDALFPVADKSQREALETMIQAAELWARRSVKGSTAGNQGMAAAAAGRALGPVAAVAARAFAYVTPKVIAEWYTKPGFSKASKWLLGAAAGNVGAAIPDDVAEFLAEAMKAE